MTSNSQHVLIRVDAGMGIGFGHLTRCVSLASELKALGAEVSVATRTSVKEALQKIATAGATVIHLPDPARDTEIADEPIWPADRQMDDANSVINSAPQRGWDAVVVDHYQLDSVWEHALREYSRKIVVIDDLANRSHDADVIVDHNWYGPENAQRYEGLTSANTQLLIGPRYAMLHPLYAQACKNREPVRFPPARAVVSFGGTDVGGQSIKAVRAILDESEMEIDLVFGTEAAVSREIESLAISEPRLNLHVALPNLVEVLSRADIVFGAGGTATWERLCLRVPAIVTTVSENQSGVTRAFDEARITRWLGTSDTVDYETYRSAVKDAVAGQLPQMLPIVDGYGARRVALAIVSLSEVIVGRRVARHSDIPALTTAGSIDEGPDIWRQRAATLSSASDPIPGTTVLTVDEVPIGAVVAQKPGEDYCWTEPFIRTEDS